MQFQSIDEKDCCNNVIGKAHLYVRGNEKIEFCQKMRDGNYFARAISSYNNTSTPDKAFIFDKDGNEVWWTHAEPESKEENEMLIRWLFSTHISV